MNRSRLHHCDHCGHFMATLGLPRSHGGLLTAENSELSSEQTKHSNLPTVPGGVDIAGRRKRIPEGDSGLAKQAIPGFTNAAALVLRKGRVGQD